jgi:putative ABC transport system permease protein
MRKGLVVVQFVISISLLICIGVVYDQLHYLHNKDLGFDKTQVIMADLTAFNKYPSLRTEMLKNHEVKYVTLLGASIPGNSELMENAFVASGKEQSQQQFFSIMNASHDFEKMLDLEFLEGHGFVPGSSTDSAGFIINEAAAKALGWGEDVVGRALDQIQNGNVAATGTVIGLVKDFHYRPLYEPIKPLIIRFGGNVVAIKVQSSDLRKTVAAIESVWQQQMDGSPFRYSFMDTNFDELYRKEDKFSTTIQYFCGLAIFIACLGLLGLSAYTAESRKKEIGIRKVNGASIFSLLKLLTADFSILVLIAFVISIPIAWYSSNLWLNNFAYKTDISPITFVIAGMLSLILAIITVSYHTFKAAKGNPVDSLRYE